MSEAGLARLRAQCCYPTKWLYIEWLHSMVGEVVQEISSSYPILCTLQIGLPQGSLLKLSTSRTGGAGPHRPLPQSGEGVRILPAVTATEPIPFLDPIHSSSAPFAALFRYTLPLPLPASPAILPGLTGKSRSTGVSKKGQLFCQHPHLSTLFYLLLVSFTEQEGAVLQWFSRCRATVRRAPKNLILPCVQS